MLKFLKPSYGETPSPGSFNHHLGISRLTVFASVKCAIPTRKPPPQHNKASMASAGTLALGFGIWCRRCHDLGVRHRKFNPGGVAHPPPENDYPNMMPGIPVMFSHAVADGDIQARRGPFLNRHTRPPPDQKPWASAPHIGTELVAQVSRHAEQGFRGCRIFGDPTANVPNKAARRNPRGRWSRFCFHESFPAPTVARP